MLMRHNCSSNLASESPGRQLTSSETHRWVAALAFILALSASMSLAQAASAAPLSIQSPSHSFHDRHKLRGPSTVRSAASLLPHSKFDIAHEETVSGDQEFSESQSGRFGKWSTALLSAARYGLAATSLPPQQDWHRAGLVMFAGGWGKGALLSRC